MITLMEIQTILRDEGLAELYQRTGEIPLLGMTDERVFNVLMYVHGIRPQIATPSHSELVRRTAQSLIERYLSEETEST